MPNYTALHDKIILDHANDTDQQIENALNAKTIQIKKSIAIS